MSHRFLQRR